MFHYIRTSFKRELLLCFLGVAVLPLFICTAVMIKTFQLRIQSDYRQEAKEQLSSVEDVLIGYLEQLQQASDELSMNETVIETLYLKDTIKRKEMYQKLYEITAELREYAQFDLYSIGGICKYSTNDDTLGKQLPTYWGILRLAQSNLGQFIIHKADQDFSNQHTHLLQAARAITDARGNCIGFIVIEMDQEDFQNLLKGAYNSLDNLLILDSYWHTIYTTESAQAASIGTTLRSYLLAGRELSQISSEDQYYISSVWNNSLYVVLGQREIFTSSITNTMYRFSIAMAAASLVLCVVVALWLSKSLTRPLNHLTNAMHEVENGNLNVSIACERKDEIGRLAGNFNTMTKELGDYMINQVRQQQELNDVSIAMMQAQLNPHFLYNTLDTMKWVAKANHIPEIATLSSSLAKILRISISEAKFIPLKEELAVVKSYVDIQKIRFSDKFEYEAILPEEYENSMLPKLVIQPLVENAIIHGLSDRDSGHIKVEVEGSKHNLMISVSDDGCGMSDEIMTQLNNRDRTLLQGHLGFYNVDTIVRLHYGSKYGLQASAVKTGGTKVTLVLPLLKIQDDVPREED